MTRLLLNGVLACAGAVVRFVCEFYARWETTLIEQGQELDGRSWPIDREIV